MRNCWMCFFQFTQYFFLRREKETQIYWRFSPQYGRIDALIKAENKDNIASTPKTNKPIWLIYGNCCILHSSLSCPAKFYFETIQNLILYEEMKLILNLFFPSLYLEKKKSEKSNIPELKLWIQNLYIPEIVVQIDIKP